MLETGYNNNHISGAHSVAVSPRPGILKGIAVNTPIANATVTVYDGLDNTGAVLGVITLPADVTAMPPATLLENIAYAVGLYVVTTGANLDVTVIWR
jgi:hypothetical protein